MPAPIDLLLTRPCHAARDFARSLRGQGLRIQISPLIEIVATGCTPDIPKGGAVFTSASGVACAPLGQGRRAFCVGPATTAAAQRRGWRATEAGENADQLVARLPKMHVEGPLLHMVGLHRRGEVAARLAQNGLTCAEAVIYDQQACPLRPRTIERLQRAEQILAPVFSPRSAALLVQQLPRHLPINGIAISEAAAAPLRVAGLPCTVADAPNGPAMLHAIICRVEARKSAH